MKIRFRLLMIVCVFYSIPLSAQTSDPFAFSGAMMYVSPERQNDGCFAGKVYYKAPGAFTVAFYFPLVKNTTHDETFVRVIRSPGTAFNMRPIDAKQPITYSSPSNIWIMVGELNPRNPNPGFVYRLPVSTTKETPVRASFQRPKTGKKRTKSGISCLLSRGDTLFAPRKGLVIRIPGEYRITPTAPTYSSRVIQIEHEDGTYTTLFGEFGRFDILVEPGDKVYPGTSMAVVRSDSRLDTESIGMTVSYRTAEINFHSMQGSKIGSPFTAVQTIYIDPVFALPDGNSQIGETIVRYRAVETPELIAAEMSKREIKQWQKQK